MTAPALAARDGRRGREARAFNVKTELRAGKLDTDPITLTGYASVTESPYTIADWLGEYEEVVRIGAFKKTLDERDDTRLLLNHDGIPLARTKSGTLQLQEVVDGSQDPLGAGTTGLWCEAKLEPRSGAVNDIRLAMERGDLDEMSFAFEVLQQMWSPDYTQRDITELKLWDVSVVTYPANPATLASVRGLTEVDAISDDDARNLLGRLQKRFDEPTDQRHPMSLYRAQAELLDLR